MPSHSYYHSFLTRYEFTSCNVNCFLIGRWIFLCGLIGREDSLLIFLSLSIHLSSHKDTQIQREITNLIFVLDMARRLLVVMWIL